MTSFFFFNTFFFLFATLHGMWDPGIKAQTLNQWMTREVPFLH